MRNLRSVHQSQPTPSLLNFSKIEVSYLYTKDGLKKRIQGFHQLCRRKPDMNSEIGKVHSGEAEATALGPAQKRGDDVEAKLATRSGMGICQNSKI